jgi:hypothetical protein
MMIGSSEADLDPDARIERRALSEQAFRAVSEQDSRIGKE